jgi:hypothetical protein
MENPGFRKLSEELAIVVKVVTQAVYCIRARPFNNNFSSQICPDIDSDTFTVPLGARSGLLDGRSVIFQP